MKIFKITLITIAVYLFSIAINTLYAQNNSLKSLTVLNVDTRDLNMSPEQMGNLLRIEIEKMSLYEVMDRYDVAYLIEKHSLKVGNCYGKICLLEMGKILKSDKMLSGSVELYGETIIISLRLIDVENQVIEKAHVREYLNLPKELQLMLRVTLHEMLGVDVDENIITSLTKKDGLESATNNPDQSKLNLSGPRMGFTYFTGETAEYLSAKKEVGGFDLYPLMFQFGYQFEIQYLNQGNFQALVELIPIVTGLDQSTFIPSFTILNGLRNTVNGYEFAFGPMFSMSKQADGYFDDTNQWHLEHEWNGEVANPFTIEKRLDSRGSYAFNTGFVFAFGKTFRSGKLNIPVNGYILPSIGGIRFGISFGYNAKK